MSNKEKAQELVDKFLYLANEGREGNRVPYYQKECAMVVCNEMIEEYTINSGGEAPGFDAYAKHKLSQWKKIKSEIELL